LILQPIVENAIFHGLAELEEEGVITVRAYKNEAGMIIEVQDSGAGLDESTIDWLRHELEQVEITKQSGIGLPNVQRRIKLHYGSPYGIQFHSTPGAGATFVITLPEIRDEEDP